MTKEQRIAEAYHRLGGNATQVSKELGIPRSTVRDTVTRLNLNSKPIVGGRLKAKRPVAEKLPQKGLVKRFIVTSAQNNTHIHKPFWQNLKAYAAAIDARIMAGSYSYNKQAYGLASVKHGSEHKDRSTDLWIDPELTDYISDERIELAPGLVWCGELNILPTARRPLSGFESYTGRSSGIFPHAKIAMESIVSGKHEATKFNYTTGTVTQLNYIQKTAGQKAEHHHCYGALIVEIDSDGRWFVRQLNATDDGAFQDLDIKVEDGNVTGGHPVAGINWGDFHCNKVDPSVLSMIVGDRGMLKVLKTQYQILNDLCNFGPRNHHDIKDPHKRYRKFVHDRDHDTDSVEMEINNCAILLEDLQKAAPDSQLVVVDSNHDNSALERWLREADYRDDPKNAVYFLRCQLAKYLSIETEVGITNVEEWWGQQHQTHIQVRKPTNKDSNFHMFEWAIRQSKFCPDGVRFLRPDESFLLCGQIECGMHGHLGPNGSCGTPMGFTKMGRKGNTGHTHSCGIYDGIYVAATSSLLDMGFNVGPSSWSHSHVITYPNGKRCIVTMWRGKWKG